MKAALLTAPGRLTLTELPSPEPMEGEVRVRILCFGICGSDVHLFKGQRPLQGTRILGHEAIGTVDKLGDNVTTLAVGDRVVIEPNIPCGRCDLCYRGQGNHCANKRVIGLTDPGCFAEQVCIPENYGWAVHDSVSNGDAVTIEPLAVAVHALGLSGAKPGEVVAVIGLGAIGLLITQWAIAQGMMVVAVEPKESKCEVARKMGAIIADPSRDLKDQFDGQRVRSIFECAGIASTAELALGAAPRGSEVILLGLANTEVRFNPLQLVREGIRIIPSLIYDHPRDFRLAIDAVTKQRVHPGKIISGVLPFASIQAAMELAAGGGESKVVVAV
jgi:threonine dehydrogenase-like Zn-dependent dehydrogenase